MKKIVIVLFCLLLTGCVASDPMANRIVERQLVGEWTLSGVWLNGFKGDYKQKIVITFSHDGFIQIIVDDKNYLEKKADPGETFSMNYLVAGKKITAVIFLDNEAGLKITSRRFEFFGGNKLKIAGITLRSDIKKLNDQFRQLGQFVDLSKIEMHFVKNS